MDYVTDTNDPIADIFKRHPGPWGFDSHQGREYDSNGEMVCPSVIHDLFEAVLANRTKPEDPKPAGSEFFDGVKELDEILTDTNKPAEERYYVVEHLDAFSVDDRERTGEILPCSFRKEIHPDPKGSAQAEAARLNAEWVEGQRSELPERPWRDESNEEYLRIDSGEKILFCVRRKKNDDECWSRWRAIISHSVRCANAEPLAAEFAESRLRDHQRNPDCTCVCCEFARRYQEAMKGSNDAD